MTKQELFNEDRVLIGLEKNLARIRSKSAKTTAEKKEKRQLIAEVETQVKARKKYLWLEQKQKNDALGRLNAKARQPTYLNYALTGAF